MLLKEIKDSLGHMGSSREVDEEWLWGVMAFPAAAGMSPRPSSPSRVSPAPCGGDAPLAEPAGDGDIPLQGPGWAQHAAGPIAGPHHGRGTKVLPRVLLQQHDHPAMGHLP